MTEQTNQGGSSQQASDQSSSNSGGQSQQGQQRQEGQGGASDQGQNKDQSGQQASSAALPQRPAYVLETEWDSATGKVRDELFTKRVNDLSAFKAEQDVRKQSLPNAPDKYEIKLPPDFKAPEGVKFEFDANAPELKTFREKAHARGMDQETFSDALGVYAATKIAENQKVSVARTAELSKLGSAAESRVDAVATWLKARVGVQADGLVAQMKHYPVAAMVESFEAIIRQFSNQGGADFNQSGRQQQEQAPKVPTFDGSNFTQVRMAQDAINRKAASGGR
jgi:hypothetical protein